MTKFFKDILTGVDNQTYDIGRVGIAASLIMLFFLEIIKLILTGNFSAIEFSVSASAILAIGSGGLAMKSKTEPRETTNDSKSDQ